MFRIETDLSQINLSDRISKKQESPKTQQEQKLNKQLFKLKDRKKIDTTIHEIPGPGTYNILTDFGKNGIKISIADPFFYSNEKKFNQTSPGPGFYNPKKGDSSPKRSFGYKQENMMYKDSDKINPSSASYFIRHEYVQANAKHAVFNKSSKSQDNITLVPGPGTYDIKNDWSKGVMKFQSYGKYNINRQMEQNPSPTSYNIPEKNQQKSTKISKAVRISKFGIIQNIPGPGEYDYSTSFNQTISSPTQYTIGKSQRQELFQNQITPGPGSYQIPEKNRSFSPYKQKKTTRRIETEQGPGPGMYNIKNPIGLQTSMGQKIKTIQLVKRNINVGPQSYSPDKSKILPATKSIIIQTEIRDLQKFTQDDRSAYFLKYPDPQSPSISFSKAQIQIVNDRKIPGPGSYNIIKDINKY